MSVDGKLQSGSSWGDAISDERQVELEQWLHAWEQEADHDKRKGPFDRGTDALGFRHGVELTGADVFWLAARAVAGSHAPPAVVTAVERLRAAQDQFDVAFDLDLSALHLAGADLTNTSLAGATMVCADLAGTHLTNTTLAGADLRDTNLSDAVLIGANLAGASLRGANLSNAVLFDANLPAAHLTNANLTDAHLTNANLAGASLSYANLAGADLSYATLTGAALDRANLTGAVLVGGRMNVETDLTHATLSPTTQLADVIWNGVPLARLAWKTLPVLGDETLARQQHDDTGIEQDTATRLSEYEAAVRAYRLLAVALRSQGLNEYADGYAYRAQLCQWHILRHQEQWGKWLFLGLLWLLSGYGYRLGRILAAYGVVVVGFALAYVLLGFTSAPQLTWHEALLTSFTDIHGRVGVNTIFPLVSVQQWLAALESVIGIVIEGVFVAMLVQRFFAR